MQSEGGMSLVLQGNARRPGSGANEMKVEDEWGQNVVGANALMQSWSSMSMGSAT